MRLCLLACVLTLAACSANEDAPAPTESQAPAGEAFVSDETISDPDLTKGQIPARYIGVWDYVGGTCAPESDMRMEIAPREITFYESYGAVAGVGQDGADAIADLMMEGEGETWVQVMRLSLVDVDGVMQLHTSDGTTPKQADEYPRKKCPA